MCLVNTTWSDTSRSKSRTGTNTNTFMARTSVVAYDVLSTIPSEGVRYLSGMLFVDVCRGCNGSVAIYMFGGVSFMQPVQGRIQAGAGLLTLTATHSGGGASRVNLTKRKTAKQISTGRDKRERDSDTERESERKRDTEIGRQRH